MTARRSPPRPTRRHTYTKAGRYNAVLTVFDSSGQKTATSTIITAGNTTPTVQVIAPIAGGLFAFGDTLQYKVVVTDPEESSINCNDVQVTFVLGHDSHGHAEQTGNGCTGFLQTIASDVTHGGNVFGVVSASVRRQGRLGRSGAVADRLRAEHRPPEAPGGRVRHQPVRHGDGDQHRHDRLQRCGAPLRHRPGRLAAAQRADQPVPDRLDRVPLRGRRGRSHGGQRRWPAVDLRQDSITGPVIATANLTSTGGTAAWSTMTVPITNAASGRARAVPDVPHGHGRGDGREPVQPQLGRVRRQRRHGPVDEHHRRRGRHRARDAGPHARHPGGLRSRSPRASRRRTPPRPRPTSSRRPVTRR